MTKTKYFLAVCAVLFAMAAIANPESKAIVAIYSTYNSQNASMGTGFFINDRKYIVTNYHVIYKANEIEIFDYQGRNYPNDEIVLVASSPEYDLAILQLGNEVNQRENPSLVIDVEIPRSGDVWITGHPRGNAFHTAKGFFDGVENGEVRANSLQDGIGNPIYRDETDLRVYRIDVATFSGQSGSPVLIDSGQGKRVIGIISGSLGDGESLAWAIPIKYIQELIENPSHPRKISSIKTWEKPSLFSRFARKGTLSVKHSMRSEALIRDFQVTISQFELAYSLLSTQASQSLIYARRVRSKSTEVYTYTGSLNSQDVKDIYRGLNELTDSIAGFRPSFSSFDKGSKDFDKIANALESEMSFRLEMLSDPSLENIVENSLKVAQTYNSSSASLYAQTAAEILASLKEIGIVKAHNEHLEDILKMSLGSRIDKHVDKEVREISKMALSISARLEAIFENVSTKEFQQGYANHIASLRAIAKSAEILIYH